MKIKRPLADRFWGKVDRRGNDECWLWTASTIRTGYGRLGDWPAWHLAHRVSWAIHNGKIPQGMCVLHRCDNRLCVNPGHLFLGTYSDNHRDAMRKGRNSRGRIHGASKLTDEDVLKIRASSESNVVLARHYGVDDSTVCNIRHRRTWTHI